MHRVHIQEVLKYFWIIQKIRLIISKKIFVIVLQVIATTPQKSYTTWKMPQYGDFVASSPASPRTERKNYAIVGKSKKKYYFNLLIFRWSTNLNLTTPSTCCFYVQLSVTRSIIGTVHPVAMTIDTHMQNDFHFLKTFFWVVEGEKGKNRPRIAQKLVPNLEISCCDIFVTCAILKNRKAFFFLSEVVLLHQTILKEWLMFHWKILTSKLILTPWLLNLRKTSDSHLYFDPHVH